MAASLGAAQTLPRSKRAPLYVCLCHGVTEDEILDAVESGAHTEDEMGEVTHAGTGCGSCLERVGELIDGAAPYGCRLRALPRIA